MARQLRAYKRFKELAQVLRERERSGRRAYVRIAQPPPLERRLEPGEGALADLVAAMERVLAEKPPLDTMEVVRPLVVTVRDKIRLTGRLLRARPVIRFRELLGRVANRVEIVVSLWAVLELIKRQYVTAEQPEPFGEIWIRVAPGADPAAFDGATNGAGPAPAEPR